MKHSIEKRLILHRGPQLHTRSWRKKSNKERQLGNPVIFLYSVLTNTFIHAPFNILSWSISCATQWLLHPQGHQQPHTSHSRPTHFPMNLKKWQYANSWPTLLSLNGFRYCMMGRQVSGGETAVVKCSVIVIYWNFTSPSYCSDNFQWQQHSMFIHWNLLHPAFLSNLLAYMYVHTWMLKGSENRMLTLNYFVFIVKVFERNMLICS